MKPQIIEFKMKKHIPTPTILQMEAVECGAAALAMILAYHNRFEPLEKLRVECGVSRDGSKASNMVRAAQRYGLIAKGVRKEMETLAGIQLPAIIFWNFNHFVVYEGCKKNKFYINDPAAGSRVLSTEEFDQAFTGIVLTFEPGPDFKTGGEKYRFYGALKSRISGAKIALVYVVLAGLGLVVPGLVIPTFTRIFIDSILIGKMTDWLMPLMLIMLLTAIMRAVLTWYQGRYLLRFQTKLALASSSKFLWHVLRLPISFFSQRFGGEIGGRVAINNRVASLLSGELASTVISVVMIVFYAVLMLRYDIVLTLIGISISLLNIIALKYFSKKRINENMKLLQDTAKLTGTSMGALQIVETLKATGSESDFFAKWSGLQAKVMNSQRKLGIYTNILISVPTLLTSINTAVILALGGLRVMDGKMTMGMLVAFQSLMSSFISPINSMVNLASTVQDAKGDMQRLDDVLRYEADKQIPYHASTGPTDVLTNSTSRLSGNVRLENISFGYNLLESPLIDNFSLTLKPGSRVAIIGGSGSGKSTVAKLIVRLYEPWSGDIYFDGKSCTDIPRIVRNNSLAMVDQEIFLYKGTVKENLTMWDSAVPDEVVISAARDACIHDDIAARPNGYHSRVDEAGRNFSGGQRQRIEIARALTINPRILVLDEATSALDPKTEQIIDDNLRRRGCTCIIVAHRLSTIRDCDEIIVLDKGKVVQRGTHDAMMDIDGPYRTLLNIG